jgi:hypothetical protein
MKFSSAIDGASADRQVAKTALASVVDFVLQLFPTRRPMSAFTWHGCRRLVLFRLHCNSMLESVMSLFCAAMASHCDQRLFAHLLAIPSRSG